ncbi:small RNA-binding protein 11, chloroplastic [Euphorbia lathyris]|uniref:small RNA-binding protein 11, chloroplastic n=1 Tax=Euphorbia lathyris TaxID=212925 RepID=UPI003313B41A
MAALRRISGNISLLPSALFICNRGIATKLFVGGLPFHTTENGLSEAFSQYGQVVEAKIVADRVTNKPKGFGFVTFASGDEAYTALTEMDGKPLHGRVIFVDYAKPKLSTAGEIPIARGPPQPSEA